MKRLFFISIFIIISLFTFSQNGVNERIYKNFGEWSKNVEEHKLSISAFVTVKKIKKELSSYEIKLEKRTTKKKYLDSIKKYNTIYRYKIYLKSNSTLDGDTTSTWVYGIRIFVDGINIIKNNDSGLLVAVKSKPTLIYTFESPSLDDLNFYIEWDKAVHGNNTNF